MHSADTTLFVSGKPGSCYEESLNDAVIQSPFQESGEAPCSLRSPLSSVCISVGGLCVIGHTVTYIVCLGILDSTLTVDAKKEVSDAHPLPNQEVAENSQESTGQKETEYVTKYLQTPSPPNQYEHLTKSPKESYSQSQSEIETNATKEPAGQNHTEKFKISTKKSASQNQIENLIKSTKEPAGQSQMENISRPPTEGMAIFFAFFTSQV